MLNTLKFIDQESLEGNGDFDYKPSDETKILKKAQNYHINVDALEHSLETPVIPQMVNSGETPDFRASGEWTDMDVNLGDMAENILESSERVVVIVSDDRVVYMNKKAREILSLNDFKQGIGEKFLTFVEPEDWNLLTGNIGNILMEHKKIKIRLKGVNSRITPLEFSGIYLPDTSRFSFILISNHQPVQEKSKYSGLYDEQTGLPNFFLFEDRVQVAVNNENYKDSLQTKNMIAVVGISIDNAEVFKRLLLENFMYKKLAHNLVLGLKKNYTVARGLKYHFWLLMPDMVTENNLNAELEKVKKILDSGISDNFTSHNLVYSLGVSVFPKSASSAKKLIQQAIAEVKKAQEQTRRT